MDASANRVKGFLNTLRSNIFTDEYEVPVIFAKEIDYGERNTIFESTDAPGWHEFQNATRWGGRDKHTCFKTVLTVTPEMEGREIWMLLSTGAVDIWNTDNPQFLIYINDEIICGADMNHHEALITKCAHAGESFTIGVYAYSNSAAISDYFRLNFRAKNSTVEKLYYDAKVLFDLSEQLKPDDLNRIHIYQCLNKVINMTDLRIAGSKAFYDSLKEADDWLCENFYDRLTGDNPVTVHSIGHTHIDVAWKWPVRQTREKALRSFSTVLNYMNEYPEYKFMSSQPQLYEFVKEDSPKTFEKIRERVKEGRWETEGAMWLEADCNLTSGESLVRQIIKGKEFFEKEFGKGDNRVLWLPDVFGYSAALPQILKKSGIDYFMTTKINWNETNKMPHDVFYWKGIDGSEVLTYFITTTEHKLYPELNINPRFETTYNGRQNVTQVMGCWQRFSDKEISKDVLTCYGHGDGGGGTTREMLEENRRMLKGLPGMPVTKNTFVKDFFVLLDKELKGKKVPKWVGELYLEYHRGTYTSQAKNKKFNRLSEYMNEDAEWLSIFAHLKSEEFPYPESELNANWKKTLLNQFHDILPGSSIGEVYRVSAKEYEEVIKSDRELIKKAADVISGAGSENIVLFNPCSFKRYALIDAGSEHVLIKDIPSKGYLTVSKSEIEALKSRKSSFKYDGDIRLLSTPFYEVEFNENGEILKLYDKMEHRVVNKEGEVLNRLLTFEDRPFEYDAWNIDSTYEEKCEAVLDLSKFEVTEDSFEKFSIHVKRNFLNSLIEQTISFYSHSKRIDFDTRVDWKEQQVLMKAAFPVDVLASKCTCDIQFGNVERPTHRNTSWDEARYEFAAHKWVDISEADFGVALLNNCKYGVDVCENVMRLTLIKSGIFPDPDADKGVHEFTYSLLPHRGDFRRGNVIHEAFMLNRPVYMFETNMPEGLSESLISTDKENVFADTVKRAEDGNGTVIRLHEEYGARTKVKIDVSKFKAGKVIATDLLEKEIPAEVAAFTYEEGIITTEIKPYEIITFVLK